MDYGSENEHDQNQSLYALFIWFVRMQWEGKYYLGLMLSDLMSGLVIG
jgi:hypothetical protein